MFSRLLLLWPLGHGSKRHIGKMIRADFNWYFIKTWKYNMCNTGIRKNIIQCNNCIGLSIEALLYTALQCDREAFHKTYYEITWNKYKNASFI